MIRLENINKSYGDNVIYKDFNIAFESGGITVILGESGSGKTTLLNIIAGLTDYDGKVDLGNEKVVSMTFREDRLVPNLTVEENVKLVNKEADVKKLLEEVNMSEKINEYPKNLSGGQSRRVSIIRALAFPSDVLLMDEPLTNLDLSLKFSVIETIKKEKGNRTVIFVTHDVKEAVTIADRIVIIDKGKIIYDADKKDVNEDEIYDVLLKKNK